MKNINFISSDKIVVKSNNEVVYSNIEDNDVRIVQLENNIFCDPQGNYYVKRLSKIEIDDINLDVEQYVDITDAYLSIFNDYSVDELTKFPTRRKINYYIDRAKDFSGNCTLAIVDVDNFKIINDTYGHNIGDEVLREISNIMRHNTRDHDVISRWGGDEFLIFFEETDFSSIYNRLLELKEAIANKKFYYGDTGFNVTVSIGVTNFKSFEESLASAIERADQSLYDVKNNRKNDISINIEDNKEKILKL